MTATDDRKAKLHKALATLEEVMDEVIDADAVVVDPPPVDDPPPVQDPPPVEPPPPPAIVQDVQFWDGKTEFHGGKGHTIAVILISGTLPSYWKQDTTLPLSFGNSHAGGPHIFLEGCDALYCAYYEGNPPVQLWPDPTVAPIPIPNDTYWPDGKQIPGVTYTNAPPPPPVTTPPPSTTPPPPPPTTTPPLVPPANNDLAAPVAVSRLSALFTFADGSTVTISPANDMGNHDVGYGFTQANWQGYDPAHFLRVFFRPDLTSGRVALRVEYGDPRAAVPTGGAAMPALAYGCQVLIDGQPFGDKIVLSAHHWGTAWFFRTSRRPIVRTVDDLIAAKRVEPIGKTPITTTQSLKAATAYTGPMGTSNIQLYMPQTGGRGDIGEDTAYEAQYKATRDPQMLESVFAWADAASSMPWVLREIDGSMWDWTKHPNSGTYDGGQWRDYKEKINLRSTSPVSLDGAHMPELCELAYHMTGELDYLEGIQNSFNFVMAGNSGWSDHFRSDQSRLYAWTWRMLITCMLTAQSTTRSVLPKSYFQKWYDRDIAWLMTNYVNNPAPKTAVFRSGADPLRFAPWQEDFEGQVWCFGTLAGFEELRPIALWHGGQVKARTNGVSGMPRSTPVFYYYNLADAAGNAATDFAALAALNGITETADGNLANGLNTDYLSQCYAHLALLEHIGDNEAPAILDWLVAQMKAKNYAVEWQCSIIRN